MVAFWVVVRWKGGSVGELIYVAVAKIQDVGIGRRGNECIYRGPNDLHSDNSNSMSSRKDHDPLNSGRDFWLYTSPQA